MRHSSFTFEDWLLNSQVVLTHSTRTSEVSYLLRTALLVHGPCGLGMLQVHGSAACEHTARIVVQCQIIALNVHQVRSQVETLDPRLHKCKWVRCCLRHRFAQVAQEPVQSSSPARVKPPCSPGPCKVSKVAESRILQNVPQKSCHCPTNVI